MRYALVKDGIVQNVILWDGAAPYTPPDGCEAVADPDAEARIGLGYDEQTGFEQPE